jgi:hypothetical protein
MQDHSFFAEWSGSAVYACVYDRHVMTLPSGNNGPAAGKKRRQREEKAREARNLAKLRAME